MSSNKCVNCGLVNFRSEQSCVRCGGRLAVSGRPEPFFPGCPSCGSPASVTDQNCPACQLPLAQPAPAPRRVEPLAEQRAEHLPARPPQPPPPPRPVAPAPPRPRNLAPCPDCGRMVSTAALACPGCGRPFTQPAAPAPLAYHVPNAALAPNYHPLFIQPAKSRAVYIVLALFFGCLGVHNFYAGHGGRGAAQLAITILTGCAGGFFVSGLWAFIECFVVDTDGSGRRMT